MEDVAKKEEALGKMRWRKDKEESVAGSRPQKRVHFTTNGALPAESTSDSSLLPSFRPFFLPLFSFFFSADDSQRT